MKNGRNYEFENPNLKENYNNILKMKFSVVKDNVAYNGIDLEEFSTEKLDKYLYSSGSSRGGDNTPTTIISKPDRPLEKLILPIKKLKINEFIEVLKFLEVKENYELITNDIKSFYKTKQGYILTLVINNKWIGEWEEIVNNIISNNNENFYYMTSIGESKAIDKECYCCRSKRNEVYGFVSTYNFYTVDKKGFVAGGFDQTSAWKNYPICPECAETLENGKKYIRNGYCDDYSKVATSGDYSD